MFPGSNSPSKKGLVIHSLRHMKRDHQQNMVEMLRCRLWGELSVGLGAVPITAVAAIFSVTICSALYT
jgi:hypothetical protein